MENKNYIPTTPLYDCADNHGTQLSRTSSQIPQTDDDNVRYQESEFGDYSRLSHQSGPSLRSNQKSNPPTQVYDAPYEVLNRRSDDTRASATKSPQCTVGKVLLISILVLILLLLVSILAMLFYLASKISCISDTSGSINSGFTGNAGINSSLTLLQNKMDYILEHFANNTATNNSSLFLQNAMDSVMSHIAVHDNLTNRSSDKILQLLNASIVKDIPTTAAINDILLIVSELLEIQNGSSLFNYVRPVSCRNIKAVQPNSPTGYYHFNNRNIYCNMDHLCGQEGGWTRIAYLDMNDSTQNCPASGHWTTWTSSFGLRICGLPPNPDGACRSVKFLTGDISYTQICGRVLAYQGGTTDGIRSGNTSIDSPYLDGVSITRGSPRQHVWSYISGLNSNVRTSCPCSDRSSASIPSFVKNNYYCESGNSDTFNYVDVIYLNNQLWDGKNCSAFESACCEPKNITSPPWFFRDYGNAASADYLELRICCDQGSSNENVLVHLYEIYVK
uniref:Uncharacterized protein n=1 Tax=Amphimedon queenslandica TaxID=400682 RepID=A0A1X7SZ49_AMPQE